MYVQKAGKKKAKNILGFLRGRTAVLNDPKLQITKSTAFGKC